MPERKVLHDIGESVRMLVVKSAKVTQCRSKQIGSAGGRVITVAGTSMIRPYGLPGLDLGKGK